MLVESIVDGSEGEIWSDTQKLWECAIRESIGSKWEAGVRTIRAIEHHHNNDDAIDRFLVY